MSANHNQRYLVSPKPAMALVGGILKQRDAAWPDDNFTFLYHRFKSDEPRVTLRKLTHNIINANQGFLSNLYAALAWTLINVKQHPESQQRLEAEIAATEKKHGGRFRESREALDSMPVPLRSFPTICARCCYRCCWRNSISVLQIL